MDEATKNGEKVRNLKLIKQLLIRILTLREELKEGSLTLAEHEYYQKEIESLTDVLNEELTLPTLAEKLRKEKKRDLEKKIRNLELREKEIVEKGESVEFFKSIKEILNTFYRKEQDERVSLNRKEQEETLLRMKKNLELDKEFRKREKKRKKMKFNEKLIRYVNGRVPNLMMDIAIYVRRLERSNYTHEEKLKFEDVIETRMLELSQELKKDDSWEMGRIYSMMNTMWGIKATDRFKKIFYNQGE